jgi:hypothetical protein
MKCCVVLVVLGLQIFADSAVAQSREFQCVKAFSEMAPEYPRLVCEGNDWLERGRPKRALELYLKAADVPFFESPNFLIYYRIARAQSAVGDRVAAVQTLKWFDDMLAMYGGEKTCVDSSVDSKAVAVMCSEAYDPESYSAQVGLRMRKEVVQAYRERVTNLRRNYPSP